MRHADVLRHRLRVFVPEWQNDDGFGGLLRVAVVVRFPGHRFEALKLEHVDEFDGLEDQLRGRDHRLVGPEVERELKVEPLQLLQDQVAVVKIDPHFSRSGIERNSDRDGNKRKHMYW